MEIEEKKIEEETEETEPKMQPEAELETADAEEGAPAGNEAEDAETHAAEGDAGEHGQPEPEEQVQPEPEKQPEQNEPAQQPRMFTQEQVNELVGKARSEGRERGYRQALEEALKKYGVDTEDELENLFADGSRFAEMRARNEDSEHRFRDTLAELALVKSKVIPERQSDVRAILSANGMDITEENIASMAATHPEWFEQKVEKTQQQGEAPAQIPQPKPAESEKPNSFGLEPHGKPGDGEEGEKERVMKNLFRL